MSFRLRDGEWISLYPHLKEAGEVFHVSW
jgi:hypothetical protein